MKSLPVKANEKFLIKKKVLIMPKTPLLSIMLLSEHCPLRTLSTYPYYIKEPGH